jgi:hypothetical protein
VSDPKEDKDDFVDESKRLTGQFKKIGNRAIRKAREENRRLGIPNAVSRDGEIEYEMPDGEVTTENPFEETDEDVSNDGE